MPHAITAFFVFVVATGCARTRADAAGPAAARSTPPATHADATSSTANPASGPDPAGSGVEPVPVATAESPAVQQERYPFHDGMPPPWLTKKEPATQFANLSPGQCRRHVKPLELPTVRVGATRNVATPMRFSGPFRGVRFLAAGKRSPYGIFDCRLALALDAFAEVLASHGVAQVRVDNMYRPGARLPGKRRRSQHGYGLAIDVAAIELEDGRLLNVEDHWNGEVRTPPCGPEAVMTDATDEAVVLRNVFCAVARARIFHHILTPSYDVAHRNHVHLDIKRDAKKWAIH